MTRSPVIWVFLIAAACRPTAQIRYASSPDELAWDRCHDAEKRGDPVAAASGYRALCRKRPPYVRACFDEARLSYQLEPVDRARAASAALVRQYPEHALSQAAVKRFARSYQKTGAFEAGVAALDALAASLRRTEIHDTLLFEAAALARQGGDRETAAAMLLELVSHHDRWESQLWDDAIWQLSLTYREAGDPGAEGEMLRRLLDADESSWLIGSYTSPYHDDALLRLGQLLSAAGELWEAHAVFEILAKMETSPLAVDGLLGMASALVSLGRSEEACRLLRGLRQGVNRRRQRTAATIRSAGGCPMAD